MSDRIYAYAGVDCGSQNRCVFLTDGEGRKIGARTFKHSGEGLAEMGDCLMKANGAEAAEQVFVVIEVPHGPVAETLIERGSAVHALNPKQMDRFRDRFSMAGAKNYSRDEVMASSLRRPKTRRSHRPPRRLRGDRAGAA